MKVNSLIILIYILASALIGALLVSFSLHIMAINDLFIQLNSFYDDLQTRIIIGSIGLSLIMLSLLFAQLISARREREKTIAFNNPSGQVTITLFAVEDLIRKIGLELPQIKEIRPDVIATKKKGLHVNIRLILKSETNIPEFTSQLQDMVKMKIQEILGIEEQINVRIHIAKIQSKQEKLKRRKESIFEDSSEELTAPPRI